MTFACFSIAKVEFQMLNIIRYFFSLSYMPMHDMFKKKKNAKKKKIKKESKCFYGCKRVSRRYGNYRMYLKGDSPNQTIMIVCELK